MATLGNTSSPTYGWNDTSSYNQVCADSGAMNAPTVIIPITGHCYVGTQSGSAGGSLLVIWGTGGSKLGASDGFSMGSGRSWRSDSFTTTPFTLSSGSNFYCGWWAPSGTALTFGVRNSGNWQGKQNQSSATSMSGSTDPGGSFLQGETGGYIDYVNAAALKVRRSGVWVSLTALKVRRSGAWADLTGFKIRRSGVWVDPS